MEKTTAGLPNTCSKCGQDPGDYWYAKNDEQAKAGQGICEKCHKKLAKPAKSSKPAKTEQENGDEDI